MISFSNKSTPATIDFSDYEPRATIDYRLQAFSEFRRIPDGFSQAVAAIITDSNN